MFPPGFGPKLGESDGKETGGLPVRILGHYYHYHHHGDIDRSEQHVTPINKGKVVALGPSKIRTPSKKRFHPYVEAKNGSHKKKPTLSSFGSVGSATYSQSDEAAGKPSRQPLVS
ncbi:hypothetical protein LIER_25608 [Lithospermum erythrorhizon]|uniref:Uncharacterized protein n=1 Tax=Lithospermum erythrorhizon TaxID=34254 RepID=A0AAV3R938_LITER